MYKTIVVPLDSSERAEKILPHVERLCDIRIGKVILLHVIESTVFTPTTLASAAKAAFMTPESYVQQLEEVRESAEEYLAKIRSILKRKGIEAETLIETGPAADRIVNVAEERDADLIALASHGRTGLSRVFFGGVAAAVLHRSETPLLLVRSRDDV